MAGFDYLIDSEYSGAPGDSFLFNFLQIFAGRTIRLRVAPYIHDIIYAHTSRLALASDEREAKPTLLSRHNDGGNDM